jgi:hypothetical protein
MAAVGRWQPSRLAGHALASFYLAKAHITTHSNQLIRPTAAAPAIISSPELGIMIKINMPMVCKTICKQTLPYITFIGWGSEPQLQA